jgi:hypothetical protein
MQRRLSFALLLLAIIVVVLVLEALEPGDYGITYSGASPLNTLWDGTSVFVHVLSQEGDVVIVKDWGQAKNIEVNGYGCTLLFFISPEKSYSSRDLSTIRDIFGKRNVAVIVLDEGDYGNQILKAIGAPVKIQAFRYIGGLSNSSIVYGYVNISSKVIYLAYAFVSPVVLQGGSECYEIAHVQNYTVGVLCRANDKSIIVFGDGSIAINAALQDPNPLNPYRQLLALLINVVCKNSSSRLFLVDASSYGTRLMTLEELTSVYGLQKALSLYINPVRYLHYTFYSLPESITSIVFSITCFALALFLVMRYAKKFSKGAISRRIVEEVLPKTLVEVLKNICLEDFACRRTIPCISKTKLSYDCIKKVIKFAEENKQFRKELLSAF